MKVVGPYSITGRTTETFTTFRKFQVDTKITTDDR